MYKYKAFLFFFFIFQIVSPAHSFIAELSLSYNYLKRSFDELNWFANQASTAGISFYLGEKVALEFSYTNGLYVKKERESSLSLTAQRTTTQYTNSYDTSLIFLFATRKDIVQPYVKLGGAYISRRQEIQSDGDIPYSIAPQDSVAPSFGGGIRVMIGEKFAIRFAVDGVETPIDASNRVYDINGRVGLTWVL